MRTNATIKRIYHGFSVLYAKEPWRQISVSGLCQEVGISRTTFYTYYSNIECLLDDIEETVLADITDILNSWQYLDFSRWNYERPAPVFRDIYKYVLSKKDVFGALFGPYADQRFIDRYYKIVLRYFLTICNDSKTITKDHLLIAAMCSGSIFGLGKVWLNDMSVATVDDLALLNTRVVHGIIFSGTYSGAGEDNRPALLSPDQPEAVTQ